MGARRLATVLRARNKSDLCATWDRRGAHGIEVERKRGAHRSGADRKAQHARNCGRAMVSRGTNGGDFASDPCGEGKIERGLNRGSAMDWRQSKRRWRRWGRVRERREDAGRVGPGAAGWLGPDAPCALVVSDRLDQAHRLDWVHSIYRMHLGA
jgi:hypothetical protein